MSDRISTNLFKVKRPRSNRRCDPWGVHVYDVACEETPKGWRYQAACSCGYRSPVRLDPNDASHLAESHDASMYFGRNGRWED